MEQVLGLAAISRGFNDRITGRSASPTGFLSGGRNSFNSSTSRAVSLKTYKRVDYLRERADCWLVDFHCQEDNLEACNGDIHPPVLRKSTHSICSTSWHQRRQHLIDSSLSGECSFTFRSRLSRARKHASARTPCRKGQTVCGGKFSWFKTSILDMTNKQTMRTLAQEQC